MREPIYIDSITVFFQKDCKVKGTKINFLKPDGATIYYDFTENKEQITITIKKIITEINFAVPKDFFKRQKLLFQKIEIYGRTEKELANLEKKSQEIKTLYDQLKVEAASVLSKKSDILSKITKEEENLQSLHDELDESIETLKEEIKSSEAEKNIKSSEVEKINAQLENLKKQVATRQNNHDSLAIKEQSLNDSIEQKNIKITELNSAIVKEELKLKDLQQNTSLIAYDVEGFVKNAKSNINVYIGLSFLPWVLISAVTYSLFKNTEVLAAIYKLGKDEVDLATIFWSRLPFAIVVSSVLFVTYEISISFAKKILDLHQRILDLQRIGIIAKDVSEASLAELEDFTDKEKYELRTQLKMDLLRSYLSKDFGKQELFKVKNPSLLTRFLKKRKTKDENSHTDVKQGKDLVNTKEEA